MGDSVIHHNSPFSLFMKVIPFKQKGKSIFAAREKFFRLSGKGRSCLRKGKNRKEIRRVRCCCLTAHFVFSSILRIRIFCIVCCSIFFISISIIIGFLKNRSVFSQSKVLLQKKCCCKSSGAHPASRSSIFFSIRISILIRICIRALILILVRISICICIAFLAFSKKGVVFLMMLKKG
ncbi:MAG: hypothetical protein PUC47_00420 [Oscillospiraceae bacterium]|nr:hypothetical protein [Oscillospiraceae bacterium]